MIEIREARKRKGKKTMKNSSSEFQMKRAVKCENAQIAFLLLNSFIMK
jgi:hypothetical protein